MHIEEIPRDSDPEFSNVASKHGSIFLTQEWTELFSGHIKRFGIFNGGGRLIGGFVLYSEKRWGITIVRNPPFTPFVGPFMSIDGKGKIAIEQQWRRALELIASMLKEWKCGVLSIAFSPGITDMQPFIWKKFKVIPYYTYIIDLTASEKDLMDKMSSERRNDLRRAAMDGLIVRPVEDLEVIKGLVEKTYKRQKIDVCIKYLDRIINRLSNAENNIYGFITYNNKGAALAGNCCVYDKNTAYYLLGGYDAENRHRGASSLALWSAIRYARELGVHRFDFEGSMVPNIERYFRGFGGFQTVYFTINRAMLPLEVLLKLVKREVF